MIWFSGLLRRAVFWLDANVLEEHTASNFKTEGSGEKYCHQLQEWRWNHGAEK